MTSARMQKCRIVAPLSKQSEVINTLYNLELYHVKPYENGEDELEIGSPQEKADEISQLLLKARYVLAKHPTIKAKRVQLTDKILHKAAKGIGKIYDDFIAAEQRKSEIDSLLDELEQSSHVMKFLASLKLDLAQLQTSKRLIPLFGKIGKDGATQALEEQNIDFVLKGQFCFVVCAADEQTTVENLLASYSFSSITLTDAHFACDKTLKSIEKNSTSLRKELQGIVEKLSKIEKEVPTLKGVEVALSEEVKKLELPLQFAQTKKSFVAEGWVPEDTIPTLQKELESAAGNAVHLEFTKPGKKENAPVKLQNKKALRPFQFLLDLYSLPSYKEMDPTWLLFMTFPFFFGFMLGDFVYGLILFVFFWWLKKKVPAAKQLAGILMFAAAMSMIFGLFYGEYLGFEYVGVELGQKMQSWGLPVHEHVLEHHGVSQTVYEFPRIFNRVHSHMHIFGFEILSVLVIGAIIGFIHLNFGLILGFINELKSHGLWHAFAAKLSWIILEVGAILGILSAMGIVGFSGWIGGIIAIIGVILLGVGEGVQGIVEIPALLSQMLSYMRLGAVGLASVGLAVVVNENLAVPFLQKGGFSIIAGILVMFIGHVINILLGVIGPFLHGVRLHYVEFFSKFFHGGGVEFKPFGKEYNGGK